MALATLPFPVTALPGRRPGEGQGDLINCYARKVGQIVRWQRVPGEARFNTKDAEGVALPIFGSSALGPPRGQLVVDNYLVSVWGGKVTRTQDDGTLLLMTGLTLPGTGPVTLARNMRLDPGPDVVVVADGEVFWLDFAANEIKLYTDRPADDLGPVATVDYFSGYFIFANADGTIIASELQQMAWEALSTNRAVASADPLLRAFAAQPILLACGPSTIEIYQDVGSSPFPLQRVTVIPCGLLGTWAIAGGASQWDRPVVFVAHDKTVRELRGYEPTIISNEDIVADIEEAARAGLAEELIAQVYTHGDNAIWSLTSPTWTWEHNLSTGAWHRRRSYRPGAEHTDAPVPWRALFAAHFEQRWLAQDDLDGGLIEITSTALQEPSITRLDAISGMDVALPAPLVVRCESGPVKETPANVRAGPIYLDFTAGFSTPEEPEPAVFLSWSHDGGATWANPLERHLGGQGEYRTLVTLRNTGRSSHMGIRVRWECADPVPVVFHGGVAPRTNASRPRQVDVIQPTPAPPFRLGGGGGG